MSLGGEVFASELKSSRQVKRAERVDPGPTNDEAEPRSSKLHSCAYVAVIVKLHRVLPRDAKDVSQTQTEEKAESVVPPGALGNDQPGSDARRESGY
jgi:hypothetical protein